MCLSSFLETKKIKHSRYFHFVVVLLTVGAGALFLFWPELSGNFLFHQKAIGLYHYMYFTVMQHFIYDLNMLPNWWPGYDSGYPINLTLDGFLNPIFIITLKFLPAFSANNLIIFIFFIINALSLYFLTQTLKLSKLAGLISAISYGFSGVILRHTPITGIVALMPFLPLSFVCCLKIFQGKIRWFWFWLALLVYSWIGGWSEMVVYGLVAAVFFAIYLIIKNRKSENFSYRYPILFFSAVIISIIILLPWFLPVLYFVGMTPRAGGMANAGRLPTTISHFIHMLHPRLLVFYGESLPFLSFGYIDYFLYIGTLPLLLVLASFFIKHKKEKGDFLFFLLLTAGSILMTFNNSPLFWLFHKIPVLKWFGGYWKWSFVVVFSLAILAGYGIDNIKDFFKNRFSKKIIVFLWIVIFLTLLGSGLIAVFDQKIKTAIESYGISHYKNTPERYFERSENYYQSIIRKMSDSLVNEFSLKNKWVLIMLILWIAALTHLTLGNYELIRWQKWRMLAVLITFAGSVFVWTGFFDGPPTSYLKTEPATAKYLHSINPYKNNLLPLDSETSKSLIPYRIYLYTPDQFISVLSEKYSVDLATDETRGLFSREIMDNNTHIAFNFDTFFNHQTLILKRLADVYSLIKQQKQTAKGLRSGTTGFDENIKAFSEEKNLRLMAALNIQYILTPVKLKTDLEPIFTSYAIDNDKLPIYIYENPYFMPRWHFAENIKWTETEQSLDELKKIDNFNKTTLLEQKTLNDSAISIKADSQDKFELLFYGAGKLAIKTQTKHYRFFVFNENRQPFWQAAVNNNPVPLYTANYLYQAVLVPPGKNLIEFRYPNLLEQSAISAQSLINSLFSKN